MAVIEVNHLTKEYRLGALTSIKDTVRHAIAGLTGRRELSWKREPFKALDDVTFSVEEGEVVGIIGHNGAGKSTLLKHLANITTPTSGEVRVSGRVAPLIEVGAGINPELTGRENIFLNAAILGIPKKKVQDKLDEIIEFSGLEQFIDTPVKRYSSGMTIKLGFSIATSMDADILIVDEVLAVGDLAFQRKCFDKMESLIKRDGKTVLLVSHNIRQIQRICERGILLNHGRLVMDSNISDVCKEYYQYTSGVIAGDMAATKKKAIVESTGEVDIVDINLIDESGHVASEVKFGDDLHVSFRLKANVALEQPEIVVGIHTSDFIYITASSTAKFDDRPSYEVGEHTIIFHQSKINLAPGGYYLRVAVFDKNRRTIYSADLLKNFNVIPGPQEYLEPPWRLITPTAAWMLDDSEKLFDDS